MVIVLANQRWRHSESTRTGEDQITWSHGPHHAAAIEWGVVTYTVDGNPFPTERTGTLTIAGQTFTVNLVAGCTYTLSTSDLTAHWQRAPGTFELTRIQGERPVDSS